MTLQLKKQFLINTRLSLRHILRQFGVEKVMQEILITILK